MSGFVLLMGLARQQNEAENVDVKCFYVKLHTPSDGDINAESRNWTISLTTLRYETTAH